MFSCSWSKGFSLDLWRVSKARFSSSRSSFRDVGHGCNRFPVESSLFRRVQHGLPAVGVDFGALGHTLSLSFSLGITLPTP